MQVLWLIERAKPCIDTEIGTNPVQAHDAKPIQKHLAKGGKTPNQIGIQHLHHLLRINSAIFINDLQSSSIFKLARLSLCNSIDPTFNHHLRQEFCIIIIINDSLSICKNNNIATEAQSTGRSEIAEEERTRKEKIKTKSAYLIR
ncbi:hypothetical protein RYX36_030992 [Vicia faba]